MTTQQTSDTWTLRTVCFCLVATLVVTFFVFGLRAVAGTFWMSPDSYQALRHSVATGRLDDIVARLLALGVCVYFARVRTRQDFVSNFVLHPSTRRFLMLAAMLGIWIAFFLKVIQRGGFAHIQFHTYLGISSLALLVGPFLEEIVMRGFFYPAFRNSTPLVVSIVFVFAIDALLFYFHTFWIPRALLRVGTVNVVTCLLREHTKSLWPSIAFHIAYNLPLAVLE